jgi:hypothetical protein
MTLQAYSTDWYLSSRQIDYLDRYYLLLWSGSYLLSQISDADTLTRQDVTYNLALHKDLTKWYIVNNQDKQYFLSFRKLPFQSEGIVLIKEYLE